MFLYFKVMFSEKAMHCEKIRSGQTFREILFNPEI